MKVPPSSAEHPCFITVFPPLQVAQTPVEWNNYAVYSCDAGYRLVGSSMRLCKEYGTLDGIEPTCELIYCPALSATGPLSVTVSDLTYLSNASATYTCATGYSLSGSSTRSCQADGLWSGSEPACTIVTCPALSTKSPLAVSAPAITYSSNATYYCDTGFSLSGSQSRTCQADGTWSGSPPTCMFFAFVWLRIMDLFEKNVLLTNAIVFVYFSLSL